MIPGVSCSFNSLCVTWPSSSCLDCTRSVFPTLRWNHFFISPFRADYYIKCCSSFIEAPSVHCGRLRVSAPSDEDHQWEFGEMANIRSCRLLEQTALSVPVGAFTAMLMILTRVQLPPAACQTCWRRGGVQGGKLSRSSAHARMRFRGRRCHQPVGTLVLLVLLQQWLSGEVYSAHSDPNTK